MARKHPHSHYPSYYLFYPIPFFVLLLPLFSQEAVLALARNPNNVSAILIFGDSTVDPGNNNYITTIVKSDFPPYGRDLANHEPTGRFSNGKLATDFVASNLGVKDEVPPYLDKSLGVEELITGVSFASAGTGFDLLTAQASDVIPIPHQVDYFREYLTKLDTLIGKKRREDLIKRAVFVISAGTNDFIVNYFLLPLRRHEFNIEEYQRFLLQNVRELLQSLSNLGARRIGMVGLPPLGCLPLVITLNSNGGGLNNLGCIEEYNVVTRDYNAKLQAVLNDFASHGVASLVYCDIYTPALQLIQSPNQYGVEVTGSGCCGTGLVELSILCNSKSMTCPDATKYVFWDSVHPTETSNFIVADSLRSTFDRLLQIQ